LDRRLRVHKEARMLAVEGPLLIYTSASGDLTRKRQLTHAGAEVIMLEDPTPERVLEDLRQRGVSSVLVEGGSYVTAAFVEAELFDQVGVCCAPLVIGGRESPGPIAGEGFAPLERAPRLAPDSSAARGPDWILTAFRKSCLPELCANVGG
ncbi:MAG: dihydrofolate reductase family protein, partial [Acidobacteriota bacterium]